MGELGGLAACRRIQAGPGGSDRQGKQQRPQAGQPGLELESRTQSLHELQPEPAGHCNLP